MSTIWNDLRYAFRQLRKSPGFTLTAVLTLALGIGANTAVFTLVHAVMLKSLPVADPQQLYQVGNNDKCCTWGGFQDSWALYSYDFYLHMRANTPAFEELAAFQANNPTVSQMMTVYEMASASHSRFAEDLNPQTVHVCRSSGWAGSSLKVSIRTGCRKSL